jgi:hypothetical protein
VMSRPQMMGGARTVEKKRRRRNRRGDNRGNRGPSQGQWKKVEDDWLLFLNMSGAAALRTSFRAGPLAAMV